MKTVIEQLKDKAPIFISGIFAILLLIYAYGCEPKTDSLLSAEKRVNREQLNLELETIIARHQMGIKNIEEQERVRSYIFEQTLNIAAGGTVNPFSVITGLLAIFGLGAAADDVRLRKQRKKQITYEKIPIEVH